MDLSGKIIAVLPEKSGVSQRTGSDWKVQEYVIETHDNFPRKMCFSIFGADKIAQFALKSGDEVTVSFDIDAHEYNGRWFNSIRAWKVDRNPGGVPASGQPSGADVQAPFPPAPEAPAAANGGMSEPPVDGGADDLPF